MLVGRGTVRSRTLLALVALLSVTPASLFSQKHTTPSFTRASALPDTTTTAISPQYRAVQQRLARGWNTWDVHSVTTQVLLPDGLAIQLGLEHNTTESHNAFLHDVLIGRRTPDAEQVFPGAHSWNGSYTDLRVSWRGETWRIQSAHVGNDLVLLATPIARSASEAVPSTIVFSVALLWNAPGSVARGDGVILAHGRSGETRVFCSCEPPSTTHKQRSVTAIHADLPVAGPYFAADLTAPVAISTGKPRSVPEVQAALERAHTDYLASLPPTNPARPITDSIQTTLGWDTIFEPTKQRVISPVSRIWSVDWGGYVLFDWDTFFASTMASIGDRDLAYADTLETLREATAEGFVPNYARGGNWKSFDRSEPPVGAITVLGLYRKFGDRWLLEDTFPALLRWNRWWNEHRSLEGYLAWGSDGGNLPRNPDDDTVGTLKGAILESGLDNSPMYDGTGYDPKTHLMQFADVGLMSLYIADCDALASIADALHRDQEAAELRSRSRQYGAKLQTLWNPEAGMFLNKDLRSGQSSSRLSPTNFYPMLARIATPAQAREMIERHLRNPDEFWGKWTIPSIASNDPAFKDQDYWRGRIWGPMNYLVFLGLENYNDAETRQQFANRSYALFLNEWREKGHVHENYNALLGTGDDVSNSDRFYHWGALLGYIEYLQQVAPSHPAPAAP